MRNISQDTLNRPISFGNVEKDVQGLVADALESSHNELGIDIEKITGHRGRDFV